MKKLLAILLLAWAGVVSAQSGTFPALVGQRGTTTPTNCTVGQLFWDSDATAGTNLYGCTAMNTWTQISGAGSGIAIGEAVTSGTANSVLFLGAGPVLAQDNTNFAYNSTTNVLTVDGGVNAATTLPLAIGGTSVFTVAAASITAAQPLLMGANAIRNATTGGTLSFTADTAGLGPLIAAGTATTDVNALSVTQTWNAAGVAFEGAKIAITDTASAAGALAFQVLGGASATTNLFNVDKNGSITIPGTGTAAAWVATSYVKVGDSNRFLWASEDTSLSRISAGVVGIGTGTAGSVAGTLSTTGLIVAQASPASGAACTAGSITADTGFIYACTATGVWKRVAITGGY